MSQPFPPRFLSSCVGQLEFDALSRRGTGGGWTAGCDSADYNSLGCALQGVLLLASFACVLAIAVSAVALAAMYLASKFLARGNLSPVFVEMLLMLRSNLYYSVAYTWCTTLGLLWFAPYELGPVADNALSPSGSWSNGGVRVAFAFARAVTLVGLFCRFALHTGQEKGANIPTSKARISVVFHSFRLMLRRAIISRSNLERGRLSLERARVERPRRSDVESPFSCPGSTRSANRRTTTTSSRRATRPGRPARGSWPSRPRP